MTMRAWWSGNSTELTAAVSEAVLGTLAQALPFPLEQAQTSAWQFEIQHLKIMAASLPDASFFLEFAIPRMGRRADAIIVHAGLIFVLEYKVGAEEFSRAAKDQVHGYALDLKNFHVSSHDKCVIPILIATQAPAQDIDLGLFAADGVAAPLMLSATDVLPAIQQISHVQGAERFDVNAWARGEYRPTPTIIEAAAALYRGHDVKEISRSEAGAENLIRTAEAIETIIANTRQRSGRSLIFVTGVPGAGKTLAGLNIACGRLDVATGEDATFLSGNGPLVRVLRAALKQDLKARGKGPVDRATLQSVMARSPDKFIQNVHHFRDEYARFSAPPSEHVVVFDEAQRAWNRHETARFMREKRGLADFDQSEPEFLLSVMNRHPDWCTVICLVGEGQEINRGEAGIGAWVAALAGEGFRDWAVYASPHLVAQDSDLNKDERWLLQQRAVVLDDALHLAVSVRSFRADAVSAWVGAVLGNDADAARALRPDPERFPIVRTRSLAKARVWLRSRRRANERAGLLASSNAMRLKPEGLYVKATIDPVDWFLKDGADIRASDALEDVATEFDVQGLELDWAAVAWDLNLMRGHTDWVVRRFRGSQWNQVHQEAQQRYVQNAYRVLLTRARQGMVIFIPAGDTEDHTRPPEAYDAIDRWLAACGVPLLDGYDE